MDSDQATMYISGSDSDDVVPTPTINPFNTPCSPHSSDSDWDTDNEIERERKECEDFLAANPCESFETITQEILADSSRNPAAFMWSAEYGEWNHEVCKQIRANLFDMDMTYELGQRIYDRGGFDALRANYYILKGYLCKGPLRDQVGECIFNGVGKGGEIWRS